MASFCDHDNGYLFCESRGTSKRTMLCSYLYTSCNFACQIFPIETENITLERVVKFMSNHIPAV